MVSPPDWLSRLANAVTANFRSYDTLSPVGCHFQLVHNIWEVTLFASRTEIVGGAQDGSTCDSSFSVDVMNLVDQFTTVDSVSWQTQSLGQRDELGSHLAIEGTYDDNQVWLRITAEAPERFGVGRRANVNQQQIEEIW
jgi:hypothetical protein